MIIRMRKSALDAENLEEYLKVFNFKKKAQFMYDKKLKRLF